MPDDPPWWDAADLILEDGDFIGRRFNKMPQGPVAVVGTLYESAAKHAEQRGKPPPEPQNSASCYHSLRDVPCVLPTSCPG